MDSFKKEGKNIMKLLSMDSLFWEPIKKEISLFKSLIFLSILVILSAVINSSVRIFTENFSIPITNWLNLFLYMSVVYIGYVLLLLIAVWIVFYIKKSEAEIDLKKMIQVAIYSLSFYFLGRIINTVIDFYGIAGILGQLLFLFSLYKGLTVVFKSTRKEAIGYTLSVFLLFIALQGLFALFIINALMLPFI